jgi:creatinine amidohydrolase
MSQWYEMSEMTSVEFKDALPTIRIALIPTGATEQHGPNLALSTDYMAGHRLAQRLAQRLYPQALVVPPIPFGLSYHHTGFAGTITLSPETFIALCVDVAKSLKNNGINHVLFVNGHAGNSAILNVVTQKLHYELGLQAATMFYFAQAADKLKAHAKTARYGHACEIETSVLLELAPELVRKDKLQPGEMIDTGLQLAFNHQPFALQIPVPFHEQTRNGVFGDARLADPAIGRDIVEAALDRTVAFVESWLR